MGFGEHRVGLGGLLVWIHGIWGFLLFFGLILFFLGFFLTCFVVSVGFNSVHVGHHGEKFQIVGFGEHRVGLGGFLGWIYGFWRFLSFLGFILFLFGVFLTCFVVSVGFRWVLVGRKDKW